MLPMLFFNEGSRIKSGDNGQSEPNLIRREKKKGGNDTGK
jgi:hypothetical protein